MMNKQPAGTTRDSWETIVEKARITLETNGIILYPTDTIWGLGGDATDPKVIRKIFKLKERAEDKPFVLLVSDLEMLVNYAGKVHPKIDRLLQFHERPLTVVYPQSEGLPSLATGENGSVAIRIVKDDFCSELIRVFGKPIISTSANVSDQPFPKNFGEISSTILSGVDYIVPLRQTDKELGEPSVIVSLSPKGELVFLRS
ncbi:MAG: threonylcarbamoyl-AMP synthase [Saprospiraceae bacterium]|nr:threonylcarbamoyl-AMP synthase [Saprospiraceae bacterium]